MQVNTEKLRLYYQEVLGRPITTQDVDDLSVMAEVVEKLLKDANIYMEGAFPNKYMFDRDGIKQAFREFIISTMEEDNER